LHINALLTSDHASSPNWHGVCNSHHNKDADTGRVGDLAGERKISAERMEPMSRSRSGFTLVEIMIVVAIIGLLAAIAIPSFMKARQQSQQNACINNLRQIDAAKEQAALEMRWTNGQAVANGQSNVNMYIKSVAGTTNILSCPGGGSYTYNAIGANPTCTVDGHVLPTVP
jgi:prepilin-type N-terminal cleavage/methylation domain-containing protein